MQVKMRLLLFILYANIVWSTEEWYRKAYDGEWKIYENERIQTLNFDIENRNVTIKSVQSNEENIIGRIKISSSGKISWSSGEKEYQLKNCVEHYGKISKMQCTWLPNNEEAPVPLILTRDFKKVIDGTWYFRVNGYDPKFYTEDYQVTIDTNESIFKFINKSEHELEMTQKYFRVCSTGSGKGTGWTLTLSKSSILADVKTLKWKSLKNQTKYLQKEVKLPIANKHKWGITIDYNTWKVTDVEEGKLGADSGIKKGSHIIKWNKKVIDDINNDTVLTAIESGQSGMISFLPPLKAKSFSFTDYKNGVNKFMQEMPKNKYEKRKEQPRTPSPDKTSRKDYGSQKYEILDSTPSDYKRRLLKRKDRDNDHYLIIDSTESDYQIYQ